MVIPSASSTKKYVPPHLRNRAAESGYKAQPSDGQEKASPKAPETKTISASVAGTQNAPIQLNAIEWGRLSDVSRSLDGITGVFFLYFDENVEPTFCLKLPDNPYSEHFGATLFKSLGLFAPDSRLISRDSAEFATLKTTLSNQSQYYEVEKRLFEHSDRLHDLYSKLNSLDANQGHILLMDCIPGCSLEEVRREDWSYDRLNQDQFYQDLGKGLVADALLLNGDRYQFLFSDNAGNFRLPFAKQPEVKPALCFIDQSADALRTIAPALLQDTLMCKFEQLLKMALPSNDIAESKLASSEIATQQMCRGLLDSLVNIAIDPTMRSKMDAGEISSKDALHYNRLEYDVTLNRLVESLSQDIQRQTRYEVNDHQKSLIKSGIETAFIKIGTQLTASTIHELHAALPTHPLTRAIPIERILQNHQKVVDHFAAHSPTQR